MSVELKNWQALCKEKDERIKELEGKFDLIVERLEERQEEQFKLYAIAFLPEDRGGYDAYSDAIEIVKGVINERD